MKKFLAVIAIASFAVACNSSSEKKETIDTTITVAPVDNTTVVTPMDTTTKMAIDTTGKSKMDTSKQK